METKTTNLTFTAEELEVLSSALNNYGLELMKTSKTWGNIEMLMALGREDVWHQEARKTNVLWCRVFDAERELKSRRA